MAASPVMVFIECNEHHIADVSIELVCEARRLAEKIGCGVEAVAAREPAPLPGNKGAAHYDQNEKAPGTVEGDAERQPRKRHA